LADNRTERATPKRRTKAAEEGQVLRSRDLVATITLLAVVFVLAWHPQMWIGRWQTYFARVLDSSIRSDWAGGGTEALGWTTLAVAQWIAPIFGVAFVAAVASTLAQGGFNFTARPLSPNWARLNPVSNIQHLFTLAVLSRLLRSLIPAGAIFYLAFRLLVKDAPVMLHAARLPSRSALAILGNISYTLAWQSGMVLLAWSAVDYVLQRQTFEKSLRMTKQEVRQENKDNEGNPLVKGRVRRLRREMMRRSLQKKMQQATAVITNPTHYAVALEYRPATMAAPVVVAKGRNLIAQKIKELARWNEVPIVENPPLAQALYKAAEVDQMIPPNLYAAVAEILAFLYRAQMRMQAAAVRRGAAAAAAPGGLR
jgi:flagellar biosynthesis protein FlhB